MEIQQGFLPRRFSASYGIAMLSFHHDKYSLVSIMGQPKFLGVHRLCATCRYTNECKHPHMYASIVPLKQHSHLAKQARNILSGWSCYY